MIEAIAISPHWQKSWKTNGSVEPEEAELSDCLNGSPGWTRTNDPRINSPMLYQLSYRGTEFRLPAPRSLAVTTLLLAGGGDSQGRASSRQEPAAGGSVLI